MKMYLSLLLFCLPMLLWSQNDKEFKLDEAFDLQTNGIIHMDTDDAEVRITGTNRQDVRVVIHRKITSGGIRWGDGQKDLSVEVYNRDGDLYINDRESDGVTWSVMGYSYEEYRIDIEAPLGAGYDIKGDDDDYRLRNVHGSIKMQVDDGDIELTDCRSNEFEFQVDDGDILMNTGKGKLYADIEDGDLKISNGSFNEIIAKVDDGNVSIESSLNNLGKYRISSDDGAIDLFITSGGGTFDLSHDDSRISAGTDFDLIEKSNHHSSYKLSGGTAFVEIHADDGSIRLRSRKESN